MTTTTIVKIGTGTKEEFSARLVEKSNTDGILNGVYHIREYTPKGKLIAKVI